MIYRAVRWAFGAGREKVTQQIGNATEDVIRYVLEVLTSGYALVFGFPGYFTKSIINSTVGYLDPVRTPAFDTPGILTAGLSTLLWTWNEDDSENEFLNVSSFGDTGQVDKVGVLNVASYGAGELDTSGTLDVNMYA